MCVWVVWGEKTEVEASVIRVMGVVASVRCEASVVGGDVRDSSL